MDADVLVGLAVDGDRRRHLDVGVVEGGELLLPVGVLELQEDRPQRAQVVERRRRRVGLDVSGRLLESRGARGHAAASEPARTAAAAPEAAARRFGGERLARGLALGGVETLVAVLVELRDERTLSAEATRPERRRPLESTGAGARWLTLARGRPLSLGADRRLKNGGEQQVAAQPGDHAQQPGLHHRYPQRTTTIHVRHSYLIHLLTIFRSLRIFRSSAVSRFSATPCTPSMRLSAFTNSPADCWFRSSIA